MARLYLTFKDNELTASVEGIATTDTIGLECVADFLGWDDFSKTVVFYQNPRKPYRVVVHADETLFEVPHEVLLSDAPLTIGAFGVNAEGKRKTSTVVGINVTKGMFDEKAVESIKPTPSEYEQMLAFMNAYMEAEKLVDNVADAVQKATEDAREEINASAAAVVELAKNAVDEKSAEEQREIEEVGESIISRAEAAAAEAEESSVAAANSVGRVSSVEKRLSNIEQSLTPSPFVVDDTVAYGKTVPADALPYAEINKIGGMCVAKDGALLSAPVTEIKSLAVNVLNIEGEKWGEDGWFTTNHDGSAIYSFVKSNYEFTSQGYHIDITSYNNAGYLWLSRFIELEPNCTYRVRGSNRQPFRRIFGINDTAVGTVGTLLIDSDGTFNSGDYKYWMISFYGTGSSDIMISRGAEEKDFSPYKSASLSIPAPMRNLDGYGEGNPNNTTEYNWVDFETKTYHHLGDIKNGTWVPLATPETIDISDKLPLDNYIEVFEGGSVIMENEHKLAVPNTITFSLPFEIGGGGGGGGGTGENGATFYPSVSSDGVISWRNDKGLPNPTPVNIRGGDGYTPVKGVDYYTPADKAAMVQEVLDVLPYGDTASIDAPTSLSIEDGKEYHLTNVSNLTITYPAGSFECYIYLETGNGAITIVFPESKYIGLAPVFGKNETWEISIKNGVIVAGVVS